MSNFLNKLSQAGSRPGYQEALAQGDVLAKLAPFAPRVAGTPPLGIDLPGSDIDILCHAPDLDVFARHVWEAFGAHAGFSMHQWIGVEHPVIATFALSGWPVEIFGHVLPVEQQMGWRHFIIEQRLLALGGDPLQRAILDRRLQGAKTEPAFAAALGLEGDPYLALLDLEHWSDEGLQLRIEAAIRTIPF